MQFYLWQFNSPGTITSLTISNCQKLQISFTCINENKPIQWLKIKDVQHLEIIRPTITHNPPKMIFENIKRLDVLPRETFVQIKKTVYKPGCFIPVSDLNSIIFKNVNIGTIETEAFKYLSDMENFIWENVSVDKVSFGAVKLEFKEKSKALLKGCDLEVVEPMGFQISGPALSMVQSRYGNLWGSSVNGTIYDFEFNNNTVRNIQAGAISVLAQNVYMVDNHFESIESGAFKKIGPGLLHDSQTNFGRLKFIYHFSNNLIEHVQDGGIRPDIEAYDNVSADIVYKYNTLQCSCESLSWMGADVDLGKGFSVLKDFNAMVLDPLNSNKCSFTPCLCFGVRAPKSKHSLTPPVF